MKLALSCLLNDDEKREENKLKTKEMRGITLISLVVTIIVLLILARY